jgi:uncharacterized membrane protein
MRQVEVLVDRGQAENVLTAAAGLEGTNPIHQEVESEGKAYDLVRLHLPNDQVGSFLEAMESHPEALINLLPHSIFPMRPPLADVAKRIRSVRHRSPIEIWLNGLQSIGSWKGFISYALAAAGVLWVGMFTNTIYLLVAAMLLAPFAGPAMNLAIATATGDMELLWRNLVRYLAALAITVGVTFSLSILMQQESASQTMIAVSQVSSIAVLLPLVAGAAGALNLIQAENSSLVSGAATGILVAASLSPPAGLIGMSLASGRFDLIPNAAFILTLQLMGINLAGALVFGSFGMDAQHARYQRGQQWVRRAALAVSALSLAGLLVWQFSSAPELQRSTQAQRALGVVQEVVDTSPEASLVEADLRFTRPNTGSQETLLGTVFVRRMDESDQTSEEIARQLARAIQQSLLEAGFDVEPLIHVTVLEPVNSAQP